MDEEEVPTSGKGQFLFPDNGQYAGEWEMINGKKCRHGKGKYIIGVENYTGDWVEDLMDGVGEYMFSSGAKYSGEFKNNKFNGQGTYIFPDGASYTGEWVDNKMHGNGCYTDPEGIKFEGNFLNGYYDSGRSYVSLRPEKTTV